MKQTISLPVTILRKTYYTYLMFIPALAATAAGLIQDPPVLGMSGWWFFGGMGVIALYLGISLPFAPKSTSLWKSLFLYGAAPVQVALSVLVADKSIWEFFLFDFFVASAGIILLLFVIAIKKVLKPGPSNMPVFVPMFLVLVVGGLAAGFYKPLSTLVDGNTFSLLFLVGATITAGYKYSTNAFRDGDTDAVWSWAPFLIGGVFLFIFLPEIIQRTILGAW